MYYHSTLIILKNAAILVVALMIIMLFTSINYSEPEPLGDHVVISKEVIEDYLMIPDETTLTCFTTGPKATVPWMPADEDIEKLEEKLNDLQELRIPFEPMTEDVRASKSYLSKLENANRGRAIWRNVSDYFRQYIGVTVNDEKVIFINAVNKGDAEWGYEIHKERNNYPNPKEEIFIMCDSDTWAALYHPDTKTFSTLIIRGRS